MIRPTVSNNTYKEDILCQIIDWKDFDMFDNVVSDEEDEQEYDEENPSFKKTYNKKLMISGYGVTDKGNYICIHI